jgi:hypothetical protein
MLEFALAAEWDDRVMAKMKCKNVEKEELLPNFGHVAVPEFCLVALRNVTSYLREMLPTRP